MNDDQSRRVATSPDEYSLTIEDAAQRYEQAGHPRTLRSIQRYCAKGHLESLRQETAFGDKYLITPASVARHVAQIEELARTTSRGMPRLAATDVAGKDRREEIESTPATGADLSRPVAAKEGHDAERQGSPTSPDLSRHAAAKYVERIEGENDFLRAQIGVKDDQIKDLTERARETNHLIAGLQKMLTPLLGRPSDARDGAPTNGDIRGE